MKNLKKNKLGKVKRTPRGFELIEFADFKGHACSLQQSSLALYDKPGVSAVWMGPDDAKPIILAHHAARLGIKTHRTDGWVAYPVPKEVSFTTRMHLTRDEVESLIKHLTAWLKTGSFKI